jgi:hypothetical protein
MVIRVNSRGFTVAYDPEAWTYCAWLQREGMTGQGTGNTNVAKRVDPEHLSYMSNLVQ